MIKALPNFGAWVGKLRTARNPVAIRGVYLSAVQRGAMGWLDFVFLSPLEDTSRMFALRDYLLAFLFDKAREEIPEEPEEGPEGLG